MRIFATLITLLLFYSNLIAQPSFGIGTDTPDAHAIFEAQSTDKGILIPRLTTAQRNGITGLGTAQEGLLIYNTNTDEFNYWDGSGWVAFPNASADDIDFYEVGTATAPNAITDNIFTQGNVGIGETTPNAALHVNGGTIPFRIEVSNIEKLRLNNETLEFLNTGGSVFIGLQAGILDDNTNNDNVAIGRVALTANTTGTSNIAIGSYSLNDNVAGNYNIGIGHESLAFNTASNNIGIGYFAMYRNNTGTNNIAYGYSALYNNSSGDQNAAFGYQSLLNNTTADNNIGIGYRSLFLNSIGAYNIGIGTETLRNNNDSYNIGIGYRTLFSSTSGTYNIAIGSQSIQDNTSGDNNAAIGYRSLYNNTTGNNNIAFGTSALLTNTGGGANVAIGTSALNNNTDGFFNIASGYWALYSNTSGYRNIGIGDRALYSNTTNSFNIALGFNTLYYTTGEENVAIGIEAGYNNTTGSGNVFIGNQAGYSSTTTSNQLFIDNSPVNDPLIYGSFSSNEVGINWDAATALPHTLSVNGSASNNVGGAWINHSDSRLKKDIQHLDSQAILDKVLQMQGITYEWNDDKTGMERPVGTQYGFIAQDLQMVWPSNVLEDPQGYLQTAYGNYDPMFVEAFKAQQAQIEALKKQNELYATQIKKQNVSIEQLSLSVDKLTLLIDTASE